MMIRETIRDHRTGYQPTQPGPIEPGYGLVQVSTRPGQSMADGVDRAQTMPTPNYESWSVAQWLDALARDPEGTIKAFREHYAALPDSVKNNKDLQLAFNEAVQESYRTTAFIANMQTALHETLKAIISNCRV